MLQTHSDSELVTEQRPRDGSLPTAPRVPRPGRDATVASNDDTVRLADQRWSTVQGMPYATRPGGGQDAGGASEADIVPPDVRTEDIAVESTNHQPETSNIELFLAEQALSTIHGMPYATRPNQLLSTSNTPQTTMPFATRPAGSGNLQLWPTWE